MELVYAGTCINGQNIREMLVDYNKEQMMAGKEPQAIGYEFTVPGHEMEVLHYFFDE